jgi:hypothetical protein
MSSATNQRISPPAVRNAASVMPNRRKSAVPVAAKTTRRMVIAMHARRAVRRRCSRVSSWVMTRYVGITAMGSTMNSTEVVVTSANCASSFMA